jgi:hypothetical protein
MEYYEEQFKKLGLGNDLKIKFVSKEGETNFLNIDKVQMFKILRILQIKD